MLVYVSVCKFTLTCTRLIHRWSLDIHEFTQKEPKNISLWKTDKATMATANSVPLDAPGVATKRGEDPAVDSSYSGEEEGGVKEDDND
jgi:hypothetical protein